MDNRERLSNLVDEAEELISQLDDVENPEVQRLRSRIETAISGMKDIVDNPSTGKFANIRRATGSFVSYVNDYPWVALITGTALAWTLGHLSAASREKPM